MPKPLPGSDSSSGKALPGEHVGIDDATPRYIADNVWSETEQLILREIIAWWLDREEGGAAPLATPIAAHLSLPNLRAYWPGSSIDHAYNLYDLSGAARTLTPSGSSIFPIRHNHTGTVYISAHDDAYYSRAHESALSLTTDFTAGVWVRLAGSAAPATLIGKMGASGHYSWAIRLHNHTAAASTWRFLFSEDGSTLDHAEATVPISAATPLSEATPAWHHLAATFAPLEAALYLDGKRTLAAALPAALAANAQPLTIATSAYDAGGTLDCAIAHAFICGESLPPTHIAALFHATRHLFGA